MRYEGITATGLRIGLGQPIRVQLSMEEDAPAHGFTGIFPLTKPLPELREWKVYDNEEKLLFGGMVDRQKLQLEADGCVLQLTARSKACLLLDNEAKPQTYVNPSLSTLFANHGAPYGLQKAVGKSSGFYWTYVIPKGISEWQVFWDFSLYCLGIEPTVTPDGILDVTGKEPKGVLLFSNSKGIAYTSLTHDYAPCKQLSQLWLQGALGEGYNHSMVDLSAVRRGICRGRYVTAANWQGRRKLKKARRQSDSVKLVCPGFVACSLKQRAVVREDTIGVFENYSVAGWTYTLDGQGERCTITLRTEE